MIPLHEARGDSALWPKYCICTELSCSKLWFTGSGCAVPKMPAQLKFERLKGKTDHQAWIGQLKQPLREDKFDQSSELLTQRLSDCRGK